MGYRAGRILCCLVCLVLPCSVSAQSVVIRNEAQTPVLIQMGSVVRGVLRRDPPVLLKPGDVSPGTALPGNKIITIHDARAPNRILYQGTIPGGKDVIFLGITPDPNSPRLLLDQRRPFAGR